MINSSGRGPEELFLWSGNSPVSVRPSVQLSISKHFLLSHLLQDYWSDIFETWSEYSPQCLVVQVQKAVVGHLWFFLLSHLLRNYLTDLNETCLLCSPQCLVVQVQKKIRSVDKFDRLLHGLDLVTFPIDRLVIASPPRPLVGFV